VKKFTIPHVFILLSYIILFCSFLTYVIPSGTYEREIKQVGQLEQTLIIPGSYQHLPKHFSLKGLILGEQVDGKASPVSLLGLFTAIPKGMNQAAALIFFVFIIGAVFNLIRHTGTVDVVMSAIMQRFRNHPMLLLFGVYLAMSCASSFMGMASEFIPMIPIFLLIAKRLGYDRTFGIALFILPVHVGWTTAMTNPFTVMIAQQIAEIPLGSGMGLRLVLFLVCFILGFAYFLHYGKKVKNNPSRSLMPDDPFELSDHPEQEKEVFHRKHLLIVITAAVLFAMILYAVQTMGWGLIEMTGGFFTVGLLTILISGMSGDESMKAFVEGLEVMIVPALIVGFARGIQVVMKEGLIIDTMLYHTAEGLQHLPVTLAAGGMFCFQAVLNFFIPSASGQALVTMPLMVPLSDLLNISRQTAVLAFILGDGFSNLIIPTNGVLMAILGIAGVPFEKWFRFVLPLFLVLFAIGIVFLMIAVLTGY
jgi:uncharacterized ion transporter superfamily protein YfcC